MPRTTLAEIAEQLGVTAPTVSKVLNGRRDVSPGTRARIRQALDDAGYQRRGETSRRSPGGRTRGCVDLVLNPIGKSWAAEVLGGVHAVAATMDCDVIVTYAEAESGDYDWLDRIIRRGSRGVILERWMPTAQQQRRLADARIPCVIIDPATDASSHVFSVGATNWTGGHTAARHLLDLGHRRIAVIGGLDDMCSRARVSGFSAALASEGVALPPAYVRSADWSRHGACQEARSLLALAEPPTAIFACSDRMAVGVYAAARESGLAVPADLSVVGFDDLPENRWVYPALTTVAQPAEEMGMTAMHMIAASGQGVGLDSDRVELSTSLKVRESTAPPPRP